VIVLAVIASLKVAVTAVVVAIPVAPLAGLTLLTVGGVVSAAAAVVKDHVKVAARALPAKSFTPFAPPTTVAVYCTPLANALFGVSVAVLVLAL
jgi:hypothetical protein